MSSFGKRTGISSIRRSEVFEYPQKPVDGINADRVQHFLPVACELGCIA
jgi:hypothetical protein